MIKIYGTYEGLNGTTYVLWQNKGKKWHIICDGYGLGITGDYCDRPVIYEYKRVVYDFPERLPEYVKDAFERLAAQGKIWNRMLPDIKKAVQP